MYPHGASILNQVHDGDHHRFQPPRTALHIIYAPNIQRLLYVPFFLISDCLHRFKYARFSSYVTCDRAFQFINPLHYLQN
jgi:hypothetical protein